jgi:hypothetical protein
MSLAGQRGASGQMQVQSSMLLNVAKR